MGLTLYGIPNCDTVKRARAWLAGRHVEVVWHDFKKQGVPEAALDRWVQAVGWEKLLNRQGTTWRKLDAAIQQDVVGADSAKALMLSQPSVIRRPVVQWPDGEITAGFSEALFAQRLG